MLRHVAKAFLDGIKARIRTEQGEPRSPCMGGDDLNILVDAVHHLHELDAGHAEDRPAIIIDPAFLLQGFGDLIHDVEVPREHDIVDLPPSTLLRIDERDLCLEDEAHPCFCLEDAGVVFDQLFPKLVLPERMGEIAGAKQMGTLDPGIMLQHGDVKILRAGTAVLRVDVEVGDDGHAGFWRWGTIKIFSP